MKNYYDPMLFASTPEHPGIAGVMAVLKEEIDVAILQEVVESLRDRFPYFYVRPAVEDSELIAVPNPLPIIVRNTWEPTRLMSKEANYHLTAFKYEGTAFAMETSHLLTDGAGLIPYFMSVLYCYLTRKTGETFDPEGFRLPGQPIPETEIGDPFPGLDLESAKPFYKKKTIPIFYRLSKRYKDKGHIEKSFFLKIPEEGLIRICKEKDGSPNALIAVLLAKAVRKLDPDSQKTILCAVAINHKAMLGNHENYRLFSDSVNIDFQKKHETDDLTRMCTIVRGQLMLQAQPENSICYVKQVKDASKIMGRIPLPIRTELMKKVMDMSRATFGVSYPISKGFGPLDPYISEVYGLSEADVYDVLVEVVCLNHTFFLSFFQKFSSEEFLEAFVEELNDVGIPVEIARKEDRRMLSGVCFEDVPGMKPMSESIKDGLSDIEKTVEEKISNAAHFLQKILSSPL